MAFFEKGVDLNHELSQALTEFHIKYCARGLVPLSDHLKQYVAFLDHEYADHLTEYGEWENNRYLVANPGEPPETPYLLPDPTKNGLYKFGVFLKTMGELAILLGQDKHGEVGSFYPASFLILHDGRALLNFINGFMDDRRHYNDLQNNVNVPGYFLNQIVATLADIEENYGTIKTKVLEIEAERGTEVVAFEYGVARFLERHSNALNWINVLYEGFKRKYKDKDEEIIADLADELHIFTRTLKHEIVESGYGVSFIWENRDTAHDKLGSSEANKAFFMVDKGLTTLNRAHDLITNSSLVQKFLEVKMPDGYMFYTDGLNALGKALDNYNLEVNERWKSVRLSCYRNIQNAKSKEELELFPSVIT